MRADSDKPDPAPAPVAGERLPGGWFLASMGADASPDEVEDDWLGVPMFFSHFGARRNRRMVEDAGLVVEEARIESEPEDRHDARFLWIVARAPAA